MMAGGAALVESMDWAAGSIIEDGSAGAAGAGGAIVRAVLELPGGGQQRDNEDSIEYLWRCGALRGAARAHVGREGTQHLHRTRPVRRLVECSTVHGLALGALCVPRWLCAPAPPCRAR